MAFSSRLHKLKFSAELTNFME